MGEPLSFAEALGKTEGQQRALLLGNGFSASHFDYATLLESALPEDSTLRAVFDHLGTNDFEKVVEALSQASHVEKALGHADRADALAEDAASLKRELILAIAKVHPDSGSALGDQVTACAAFLGKFRSIFTTNYDLLLYWVRMNDSLSFTDGFGKGTSNGHLHGPFVPDAQRNIHYLHGALHLFVHEKGIYKVRRSSKDRLIEIIRNLVCDKKIPPKFVFEGSSEDKRRSIEASPFLKQALKRLQENRRVLFVYGSSLSANDAHIYEAVFGSKATQVFVSVYDHDDLPYLKGEVARYVSRAEWHGSVEYYDARSAAVWG